MITQQLTEPQWIGLLAEWMGVYAVVAILAISPRFKQPVIGFRYPRRDAIIALSLFLLAFLLAVLFYAGQFKFDFLAEINSFKTPIELKQMAMAVVALIIFIIGLLVRQQPPKSAGWQRTTFIPSLQMGLALVIITIFLGNRLMSIFNGVDALEGWYLMLAFFTALAEETVFRGYMQLRLCWWLGQGKGLLATAFLFTLWRLPAWVNLAWPLVITNFVITLATGLLCGWMVQKSQNVSSSVLYRTISMWLSHLV